MSVAREAACVICSTPIVVAGFGKRGGRRYCSLPCRQEGARRNVRASNARHRERRIAAAIVYQGAHHEQTLARRRAHRAEEPEKHRAWTRASYLKFKYGLTPEDYIALEGAQDGLCAVCREPERRRNADGSPQPLSVDHDHATGVVRGLLCARCNAVLGWIETPGRLPAALAYLRSAEERQREVG